jgi:hypothetical protein
LLGIDTSSPVKTDCGSDDRNCFIFKDKRSS